MQKEFKVKSYHTGCLSFYNCFSIIGIILLWTDIINTFVNEKLGILINLTMLIGLGMLQYALIFRKLKVICTEDQFLVFKGNKLLYCDKYYKAKFEYSIQKSYHGTKLYLCCVNKGRVSFFENLAPLGIKQFTEICKILNSHRALDLARSSSELKWFKIES